MLSVKIRTKEFGLDGCHKKSEKHNIHPFQHPSNFYVLAVNAPRGYFGSSIASSQLSKAIK